MEKKDKSSFAMDLMMGGVSAAVGKTVTAPYERTKLRLSQPYSGTIDLFRGVIANQGVTALWRGNTANVMR
jgi:solute carrier family 25 (adenine nucleotide translocator) protein 4/5/6/31